jgi:DnaK suppressor protein
LDQAFVDKQRQRLIDLRNRIIGARRDQDLDEASVNADVNDQAHEYEDDAQRLTTVELKENLSVVEDQRLIAINRALQKIDEGTYGLSDVSGTPIPLQRLEASPEAVTTLEEQGSREKSA